MALDLTLRVGDTSGQDISLVSNGVMVERYDQQSPDVDQTALKNMGDGNGLSIPSFTNVTETIDLHISAATPTLVKAKVQAIETLLDLARQGTTGWLDDKLYLLIEYDQDTEPWRSQILAAKLVLRQVADQIWRNYVQATIVLTRRYYWESEALHTVEATSGTTTTATTGYVTVYNQDDVHATQQNWWQIAAAQVEGSLPAPAKISVKNNSGGARSFRNLFIGNYVHVNPTTVDPVFRVEAGAGTGAAGTTESDMFYWGLAGDNLTDAFKGQFGRVVAVFTDRPASTTLLRAALQYRGPAPVVDLAMGEQSLNADSAWAFDFGAIPIPPGGFYTDISSLLYITLKGTGSGGTDTTDVDWMQVFPTGAGRFRTIKAISAWSLANGDQIIDDGPAGAVYTIEGGNNMPVMRPFFTPIYLWPNKVQRLRLLIGGGNTMEAGQIWQVKTEYRPRRLTV